jgi:hypothetical protein
LRYPLHILLFAVLIFAGDFCIPLKAQLPVAIDSLADKVIEVDLGAGWQLNGKPQRVPFQMTAGKEAVEISCVFSLPDLECYPDTLYLCLEGVAWKSEMELNGAFLDQHEQPFEPWIVPVHRDWLQPRSNRLVLHIQKSRSFSLGPIPFFGIFRKLSLLDKAGLQDLQVPVMEVAVPTGTVCVYAPYYRKNGFVFHSFESLRDLMRVREAGVDLLYFPFEPSRQQLALCRDLGFRRVMEMPQSCRFFWLNAYPYEIAQFPYSTAFWMDTKGNRTFSYGTYRYWNTGSAQAKQFPSANHFSWLVLGWLLGLFIIRVASPPFFSSLDKMLLKPQLYLESHSGSTFGDTGMLLLLFLVKIGLTALVIAEFFYFLDVFHQWEWLSSLHDDSLFRKLFSIEGGLGIFYGRALLLVGFWELVRYLFLGLIGSVYRMDGLVSGAARLEIVSGYPLVLFAPLPLTLLFFTPVGFHVFFLILQLVFLLLWFGRSMVLHFNGMEKLFGFSYAMNVLYICAANLLPVLAGL